MQGRGLGHDAVVPVSAVCLVILSCVISWLYVLGVEKELTDFTFVYSCKQKL